MSLISYLKRQLCSLRRFTLDESISKRHQLFEFYTVTSVRSVNRVACRVDRRSFKQKFKGSWRHGKAKTKWDGIEWEGKGKEREGKHCFPFLHSSRVETLARSPFVYFGWHDATDDGGLGVPTTNPLHRRACLPGLSALASDRLALGGSTRIMPFSLENCHGEDVDPASIVPSLWSLRILTSACSYSVFFFCFFHPYFLSYVPQAYPGTKHHLISDYPMHIPTSSQTNLKIVTLAQISLSSALFRIWRKI